jgi:hypothetical protein
VDPTPDELAFIASHRLAVDYGFRQGDLDDQLVAFVCAFRHDGVCDGAIWLPSRGPVPVGVRPVTEPPEKVLDWRRAFDLKPDEPVYAIIDSHRLRVWVAEGSWFVDDSRSPLGGRRHHSFRWRFGRLP